MNEAWPNPEGLLFEKFNQEYLPYAENKDSEYEGGDVNQLDIENASDEDSGRGWTGYKSKRKQPVPVEKVAGSRRRKKTRVNIVVACLSYIDGWRALPYAKMG